MLLDMNIKILDMGNGKVQTTVSFMDEKGHYISTLSFSNRSLKSSLKTVQKAYHAKWAELFDGVRSAIATDQPHINEELPF